MVSTVQSPDPRARRFAVLLVLVFLGLGLFAMFATNRFVSDLRRLALIDPNLAIEQATSAIKLLALSLGVGLAVFAWWLFRLAQRTRRFELFPPPGQVVIRETRILTGAGARARARFGFVLAAITAVLAVALPVYLFYITSTLGAH